MNMTYIHTLPTKINVRAHKVSKQPDLPTIAESRPATEIPRNRSSMRRQLMRQGMMALKNRIAQAKPVRQVETSYKRPIKFQKIQPGIALMAAIQAGKLSYR